MNQKQKMEYIKENAPIMYKSFRELDIAKELAVEEFKQKHGFLWKLKVSKKEIDDRMIEIATERKIAKQDAIVELDDGN